jgi:hypothetical protein
MVHVRNPTMKWLGLALGAALILSACSEQAKPASVTTPSGQVSPTMAPSTDEPSTPSTGKPPRNDLQRERLTRSLMAGDVGVTVKYSLRSPVQRWSRGVSQPLTVSLNTASQSGDQKVYLSRVTVYFEVSDAIGHLDSPDRLVDRADISPGFLVTRPSSYTQVFVLPPLPDEATKLTIDFSYELLVLQPRSSPRDFSQEVATDTIVISRR